MWILIALSVSSCSPSPPPIAEGEFRATLLGTWQGTVGDMRETVSFRADDTFVAQLRPMGFISNTLSQGVTGTIHGTWSIHGKVVAMKVVKAENERLRNRTTSSTIATFQQNRLTVRSASGETSKFERLDR
jgi:hypothetical protein